MKTTIGIDPDVTKSGVAIFRDGVVTKATALPFHELLDLLRNEIQNCLPCNELTIVIEAGWKNASNWHIRKGYSPAYYAKMGEGVGRCHQVGILLNEYCEAINDKNAAILTPKPLKKIWRGRDGKITAGELERLTRYKGRTNQEARDACLLAWSYRNY